MKNFMSLRILDLFGGVINRVGADYKMVRRIMQVKLTLDRRRVPTLFNDSNKKDKDQDKNYFFWSMLFYMFIGSVVLVPIVVLGENYMFQMSLIFGVLMFMIMTLLISDFSSVLLDLRDKNILGTKPVSSKTINVAKILHILIYMMLLTFSLCGTALIAALFRHGFVFFIVFLVSIIFADLLIVVLTALFYLLILRVFDGEKLKDIITYVQIVLSIGITVGYQFVGRLFNFSDLQFTYESKFWHLFIIPSWYGSTFDMILNNHYTSYNITSAILAFGVPIIAICIYIKLIPVFERNLQKLNQHGERKKKSRNFAEAVSVLFSINRYERTYFKFAYNMFKTERDFKLKVYPSLGIALVFPYIMLFNILQGQGFGSLSNSKMYLWLYMSALIIPNIVMMSKHSSQWKGSWIYRMVPYDSKEFIIKGTLKAALARLVVPIYIINAGVFIGLFGVSIIPDIVVIFISLLAFTVICFIGLDKGLPFSENFEVVKETEGLKFLGLIIVLGVFAFLHYIFLTFKLGIYLYLVLLLIFNFLIWKIGIRLGSKKVL
ncbi:hypothetical protein EDC18_103214 [Natranaerovirga pectinivora]|uniref:ABC-2 type transport system permease protein n=1 Tax=Natranaerovirga pectinivora TaxID=682400 RepID=A0A4R3MPH4_9FIRM|nr:hypothetical protein [Natranaerovirga pectinivora]TCT15509.1 hypothetical protein EDC18_103214 [Natranaerovirga pectinivora]